MTRNCNHSNFFFVDDSRTQARIFFLRGIVWESEKNRPRSGRFRFFLRARRMDECADTVLESSRRVIYGQSEGYMLLVDLSLGPQDLSGTCMVLVEAWMEVVGAPDIRVNH